MAFLRIQELSKGFVAHYSVLTNLNLEITQGKFVCLLGASGSGKTTLLRIIAGLEQPDKGELWLEGQDLRNVPVHERRFGFMFQDHVLFPHKSVGANIAYGLQMQRWPKAKIRRRVAEMLDLVRLSGYEKRNVRELSGGESQRVALARSLAPSPRLLLLDEPLSSLDRNLRDELGHELRNILRTLHITAIYVTHDQDEAFALADQVAILHEGQILCKDTPEGLHQNPGSVFAARFLRMHNILPWNNGRTRGLPTWLRGAPEFCSLDGPFLLIRPDALVLTTGGTAGISISARVKTMSFRGRLYEIELEVLDDKECPLRLTLDLPLTDAEPELALRLRSAAGTTDTVTLALKPDSILPLTR